MAGNTVKEMTTNFGKLDKFEGHDFRRWQKKMHFLLTTLKVVYVLTTPMPELMEDDTVENVESAKELWDSLESKYMVEDASSKKFLESKKGKGKEVVGPSVNMTEEGGKNKNNKQNKGKKRGFNENNEVETKNNASASGSGKRSKDQSQDQYRCWFKTYEPVEDGSVLYMGDDHFAPVHGKGKYLHKKDLNGNKRNTTSGIGLSTESNDTMNDDNLVGFTSSGQEDVTQSVVDMTVVMEKQNSLDDTTVPESFPPLSTLVTSTAGNAPGKSSYANITSKPSGKKVNVHTLFTPGGNRIDVVVLVDSIRAISKRFANTAYGFFLGKKVAYPVVANYVRNT
ncbi:hypothetical protein Tco_0449246 [Tanacetum coccineum]